MRGSCLKAIAISCGVGLACCGLTYWLFARPDVRVALPDVPDLSGLTDLARLEDWPPELATLASPPGGLFGVPSAATHTPDERRSEAARESLASGSGSERSPADLVPFRVAVGAYPPHVAVLGLVAAGAYMAADGYRMEIVPSMPPGSGGGALAYCEALTDGEVHAVATTLESVALCAEGFNIAVPIGQSLGNDVVLAAPAVEGWADAFAAPLLVVGDPAAAYLACLANHVAMETVPRFEWHAELAPAIAAWLGQGDAGAVAAREPHASSLRAARTDARVLASSDELGAPLDVIAFADARVRTDPSAFDAFARAYYQALRKLARDPEASIAAFRSWSADEPAGAWPEADAVFSSADALAGALAGEAFASLGDAAVMMAEPARLERRLSAAAAVWQACGIDAGPAPGADWSSHVAPRFVLEAREDPSVAGGLADRPGEAAFAVTDATDASPLMDDRGGRARRALEAGVSIAFVPGSDEYADPEAAEETLADAVRYLRTCADCLVRIQPAAAATGTAACLDCPTPGTASAAPAQARRVYYDLRLRLAMPRTQLLLVEQLGAVPSGMSGEGAATALDGRVLLLGDRTSGP